MTLQDILKFGLTDGISIEEYQEILDKISRLEKRSRINLDNMQHWAWVLTYRSGTPEQVAEWQNKLSRATTAYERNVNELTLLNKKIGRL